MTVTKEQCNTQVLSLHDAALSQIFFTSSICNVYRYNFMTGAWDKLDYQGSLFLYSRITTDGYSYAALVLNRNNPKDFSLGITPRNAAARYNREPLEIKLEGTLIMVQVSAEEIFGLYLHDEADREKCFSLMEWCLNSGTE